VPLLTGVLSPSSHLAVLVAGASLVLLALLGGLAARVGGARVWVGAARVTLWSALAMGVTAAAGALFGGSG
jgi:VIT1/CCC1 family predicted Fe2+/Mn2+ transporter